MTLLVVLTLTFALITRLALLFKAAPDIGWNSSLVASFGWGLLYDLGESAWCVLPLALLLAVLPAGWFEHRLGRALAHAAGKPFHFFLMTTSNHRPFTFPAGRIDLASKTSGRDGGVKYTDYAIGKFIAESAKKPWFKNTIFAIVADHCASAAGAAISSLGSPPLVATPVPAAMATPAS